MYDDNEYLKASEKLEAVASLLENSLSEEEIHEMVSNAVTNIKEG